LNGEPQPGVAAPAASPPAPFLPLGLQVGVLLVSGIGIAYQMALMRIFAVTQWHHFAYMIISIAMLGFGAAGTLLALLERMLVSRRCLALCACAGLMTWSLVCCHALSQRIPFETFELISSPRQMGYLSLLYVVLSLPFFLVSACIGLAFQIAPARVGRTYFLSMAGSGLGALFVVGLLYAVPPDRVPLWLTVPAAVALVCTIWGTVKKKMAVAGAWLLPLLVVLGVTRGGPPARVSEYKQLSYTLQYPDAKVLARAQSPLSWLTAVSSSQIRQTPGQVAMQPGQGAFTLPEQVGLFFDAGAVSVVNAFDGSFEPFAYLDRVTPALPYHLVEQPRALVIGAGGGTDVLMALAHGAPHVTALEVDPSVLPMVRERFGDFSGGLYERADVTPIVAEGRSYAQASTASYDVIHIALLDSFNASAAGVHALSESYLYTTEAVEAFMNRLSDSGVLSITRWLKSPPRDAIKMFATVAAGCRKAGIERPADHLAFVREWNTGTMVASRAPWTAAQLERIRRFCAERNFDLCYYPGMPREEANRYTRLPEPTYYNAAQAILSEQREAFYRDYLFYVEPATDERPYFFRFFKWSSLPRLLRGMGAEWVPFVEWGYIALLATLLQAVGLSVVLIMLPLLFARPIRRVGAGRGAVLVYFAMLGLGYMFLEIAFIQKFMLFLAYPVYAVGVVLTAFLFFSGCGSFFADRLRGRPRRLIGGAVAGIGVAACGYLLWLPRLFEMGAGWADGWKIAVSVACLAPLAFAMGVPFPAGLQTVSNRAGALVPWAWGINGCTSVVGAVLATLLAVHVGFMWLVAVAFLVYGFGVAAAFAIERRLPDTVGPETGIG